MLANFSSGKHDFSLGLEPDNVNEIPKSSSAWVHAVPSTRTLNGTPQTLEYYPHIVISAYAMRNTIKM